ncbi:MAG: hypothetical protein ACHQHN_08130 [Sphingobacteriales bacterium]
MEAVFAHKDFNFELPLKEVMETFFGVNTPESVKELFFRMFQCWVTKECNIKAEISDEEMALFFDQLTDLVAAAYTVHQANRALQTGQEGGGDE